VGPGSGGDQAVWSVDGVVITDMAALGSSPAYYDFDAFEEMQVTTGGSDTTIATGGVVLNMVTKRGTNEWRGSGRYYDTDNQWQSSSDTGSVDFPATQPPFKQGNRIVNVRDYGAEVGGPIIKDRLWIWGSYGRQKVSLLTIADVSDKTDLKTENIKLNAQILPSNSATAFYFNSDKVKIGRNASPTRPQETTWDQGHFGDKPTAYKVEDTHIFSSNFYLTGLYSVVNGGFELVPEGGLGPTTFWDSQQIWHNSFFLNQTERPQKQYKGDASSFFNTGSLSHELKFGAGYRQADVTSLSRWSGVGLIYDASLFGAAFNVIGLARDAGPTVHNEYTSAYAQDTLTVGNLTANIGIRYDKQNGENQARSLPANRLLPNLLPAVSIGTSDIGFEWTDVTPRLGITYALGAERKTLLRASYSRFADQLGAGVSSQLNPLGAQGYFYFYTNSRGPNFGVGDIIDLPGGPISFSSNVNPFTGGLLQSNALDPNLSAPTTDELLLGVEHALLPEFVVGANLTYRKLSNLLATRRMVFDSPDAFSAANVTSVGRPDQRSDYVECGTPGYNPCPTGTLPNGQPYRADQWYLRNGLSSRGGTFLYNNDSEQEYKGISLVFNKRLANRWMLRGNVTWANWEYSKVPSSDITDPTPPLGGGNREGDAVLQGSGTGSGSKGGVYINSNWAYNVNGLYQIAPDHPWGFNVALNLTGRQGYPIPYYRRITLPGNENQAASFVQVTSRPDSFRLDDIHIVDARVEKEFTFSDFGFTLGVDCFNVFNEAYVLQRQHRVALATTNFVREITSPRIFRIGARVSFR